MIISIVTCTADKKRDILEFFEQTNFEQMIPTQKYKGIKNPSSKFGGGVCKTCFKNCVPQLKTD